MKPASQYKTFVKHTAISGLADIAIWIQALVFLPLLTKVLGPDGYGSWSQINLSLAILVPFLQFGLPTALSRFFPGTKDEHKMSQLFWGIFLTCLLFAFIGCGIFVLASETLATLLLKSPEASALFSIAAIIIPLRIIASVLSSALRGREKHNVLSGLKLINTFVEFIAVYYFLSQGYDTLGVILGYIISAAVNAAIRGFLSRKIVTLTAPDWSAFKRALDYSLPLTFVPLLFWIYQIGDQYVIGYFHGAEVVGVYAFGYSMTYMIRSLAQPIFTISKTSIYAAWNRQDMDAFRTFFRYSYKYTFLLLIPATVGISILSEKLIILLSTREFLAVRPLIPVLALSILLFSFTHFANVLLNVQKRTKVIRNIYLFLALANLLLNIALVPSLGITGAAIATLLTFIVLFIHSIRVIKEANLSLEIPTLGKFILASTIMALFTQAIANLGPITAIHLGVTIASSALLYFVLIFAFRTITKEEIAFIKSFIPFHR